MAATHQRKPHKVKATQFGGLHPLVKPHPVGGPFYDNVNVIDTSIGMVKIERGDWILESDDGEINICTNYNFERFYEEIK